MRLAPGGEERFLILLLDSLLGFEDERGAFVEVDAAKRLRAVGVVEDDAALEDVGIGIIFLAGRLRARDFEQVAKLGEDEGVVGAFRAAGFGPPRDEGWDGGVGHAGEGRLGHGEGVTARGSVPFFPKLKKGTDPGLQRGTDAGVGLNGCFPPP
jgi:hypothetical protein